MEGNISDENNGIIQTILHEKRISFFVSNTTAHLKQNVFPINSLLSSQITVFYQVFFLSLQEKN